MYAVLKILFYVLFAKPLCFVALGLNLHGRENIPRSGPAILIANHNSHLDALVLACLFPLSMITKVRPVAAADYFLSNRFLAWFSLNILGIIPIARKGEVPLQDVFKQCHEALDRNEILILFPEGSRGRAEEMGTVKKGLFYLLKERKDKVPVIPVVMYGLGRALPRGEALFVPFNCDVVIGKELPRFQDPQHLSDELLKVFSQLFELCITRPKSESMMRRSA